MSAARKAAVDQLEARFRDLTPDQLTKVIDVCCQQSHEIATTLASLGLPGAERLRFLSAVSALAARHIAEPTALPTDLAKDIFQVFERLTNGGRL